VVQDRTSERPVQTPRGHWPRCGAGARLPVRTEVREGLDEPSPSTLSADIFSSTLTIVIALSMNLA
jgi:hypothetical protein